jgi:hypothetical protein
LFGVYKNFPENYHGIAHFTCKSPTEILQKIFFSSLFKINVGKGNLRFLKHRFGMKIIMEIGIADGITFEYITEELAEKLSKKKKIFTVLDFLCIVRYYVMKAGKKKPLRFDYYILRSLFNEGSVELQVFHEKGVQHISIEDLIMFFIKNINKELKKNKFKQLKMVNLHAL